MSQTPTLLRSIGRRFGARRAGLAALRARWERSLLASLPRGAGAATGRVLCYHGVGTPEWGINDVSPRAFRSQLELAMRLGYRFVPASVIASGDGEARDLAVTFDDALLSVHSAAAPILADLGIPWTLFVVSDWAGGAHSFGEGVLMTWREVEDSMRQGAEIGSHSVSHPNFGAMDAEAATWELSESKREIEARLGIDVDSFAIPMGTSRDWSAHAQEAALSTGYRYIYAQSSNRRPPGTLPRAFIAGSDGERQFRATLEGAMDGWEEPV